MKSNVSIYKIPFYKSINLIILSIYINKYWIHMQMYFLKIFSQLHISILSGISVGHLMKIYKELQNILNLKWYFWISNINNKHRKINTKTVFINSCDMNVNWFISLEMNLIRSFVMYLDLIFMVVYTVFCLFSIDQSQFILFEKPVKY